MPRPSKIHDDENQTPTFEEAMEQLEKIVRKMESGNLALEEIISYYEQGIRLKKICEQLLSQAEQRVAALEENADGEPVLREIKISPTLGVQPGPEQSQSSV